MSIIPNNIILNNNTKIQKESTKPTKAIQPGSTTQTPSFGNILNNAIQKPLQFSKHAENRLKTREIKFTGDQLQQIESAISKANTKGIKDSLVLLDNVALVVNVKNKLVITAMDKNQEENIFTNIDGAVII